MPEKNGTVLSHEQYIVQIYHKAHALTGEPGHRRTKHQGAKDRPNRRRVGEYKVTSNEDIGEILSVRLYKEYYLVTDEWFCKYVDVTSPSGHTYHFPCYQWLSGPRILEIPEGRGKLLLGTVNPVIQQQRRTELDDKRNTHRWRFYSEGVPFCIHVDNIKDLLLNDQYSSTKITSFLATSATTVIATKLKGYDSSTASWRNLNEMERVFYFITTKNSERVSQVWKGDTFFGYQFLNGVNPIQIQQCSSIPDNFPVTDHMVAGSLGTSTNFQTELQKGNVFLADYKILQGLPINTINGQKQYLAAPLCLLWRSPQDYIIPIAIQLGQTPGKDSPIFLPSDPEWDWTLAKMWVRNADFQYHEAVSHLLYTHLFAEVFSIATTRQLPMGHPVYKLIIPHFRYTLAINTLARQTLINPGGTFDQITTIGQKGLDVLLRRAMEELTYDSLCHPEDIKNRGVESIPNYFYRDDGMKIWLAIERLVSDVVHYYYKDDDSISKDPELQAWVGEIFTKGFLDNQSSGIPSSLENKPDLIKYLTMVIFSCSAKHAAVNSGQFDFCSWMPNCPSSMRKPPPTIKGTATLDSILQILPQVNTTTRTMTVVWVLSNEPQDRRPLGNYPDEHFTEEAPKKYIQEFQTKLSELSSQIKERNKSKNLTYLYLDPERIENSVSI
ncbi:hydroperoxide isomerase ALOXE3-like [Pelobates cultripes]|uniref:Hydroperoxide isomerase ALOXE3-like n=1 Tax=Pelobates cultripes TaxID=61616 RepID=A0AAD1R8G6_PELCU|nr:hydroperoxide isomerase ALOXE3-like [Pelobates cultripes]